ncbi:MAG: TetR/AcrR family transcriptional regulator [Planctomycetota bacterium]
MPTKDIKLKQKLVSTALELFSKQGYKATSLRQIADYAGVTHGSVRYHFGSKQSLYDATLDRFCKDVTVSRFPQIPRVSEMTKRQGRELFKDMVYMLSTVKAKVGENPSVAMSYLDREGQLGQPLNQKFFNRVIKPAHDNMKRTIQAMRPDIEDDETLEIIVFNVIAQCLILRTGRSVILKRLGKRTLTGRDIDKFASIICEFSLQGVTRLSENLCRSPD